MRFKSICGGPEKCAYGSRLAPTKALQRDWLVGPCRDGCLERARERLLQSRAERRDNLLADIGTDWPPLADEAPTRRSRSQRLGYAPIAVVSLFDPGWEGV